MKERWKGRGEVDGVEQQGRGGGGGRGLEDNCQQSGATKKIPSPPLFFHPTGRMFTHLQTFRINPVSAAFERLLTQHLKLLFTLGDEAQPDGSLLFV